MTELIANTGIQYIEIKLNLDSDALSNNKSFAEKIEYDQNGKEESGTLLYPYHLEEEGIYIDKDALNTEAIDRNGDVIPYEIKDSFKAIIPEDDIYKVRGREAIDIYAGHWIPLPYFRLRNDNSNPYHSGPQNWCRMWIDEADLETKNKEDITHILVLAFDTSTNDERATDYLKPRDIDATSNGRERFKCVTKERFFNAFYSREDISQWLANVYEIKPSKKPGYFRSFANYFVLLDMLENMNAFPEVSLLKGDDVIETGLVIDIGNSRTCGLIVETSNPVSSTKFDFTSARKLQLRDLSIPYKVYENPFQMQIAFAEEKFGNEAADLMDDVFNWPSLLRIGPEAVRLMSVFESEDSQATMSSPKRYLWDQEKSSIPWVKVNKEGNLRESALFGISEFLSTDGKVINPEKRANLFPATQSYYSRASLMTFAVFEIICQSISQINNHVFRKNMGNSSYRRKLKNIVVTSPTAMTNKEHSYFMEAVNDAIFLAKKYYNDDTLSVDVQVYPQRLNKMHDDEDEKPWKYDEATCSQIAYLYGELVEKFKGNHDLFFKYKGKKRKNSYIEGKSSITVASVDIGGGTTDLMICNYQADSTSEIPFVFPNPIFWEGFNIAGDDIIKRIIEYVVIPGIEKHLKESGGQSVEETMNYLFGANVGNQTATHRIYRKQFANQVATYCAYYAIDLVMSNNPVSTKKTFNEIFQVYPKPKNNLIPYLEKIISDKCGLESFKFMDVLIEFDPHKINHAIIDVIDPVVEQLSKLISIFDCDILLLTGRSSNLKIIRKLFENTLVISPDKIINFGNYRFGNWYPFADALGNVKDPKTTVTVGALVSFLSKLNRLPNFRVDLKKLNKIDSTAQYLGVLSEKQSRILDDKLIFNLNSFEGTFKFYGAPVSIGMRQLPSPDWISTPLYVFDYKDDSYKEKMSSSDFEYPFTITINRDEEDKEQLLLDELVVVDKNGEDINPKGYFKLSFKTLPNDLGYWRETGSFLINIIQEND